jgi:hypothetical protein
MFNQYQIIDYHHLLDQKVNWNIILEKKFIEVYNFKCYFFLPVFSWNVLMVIMMPYLWIYEV